TRGWTSRESVHRRRACVVRQKHSCHDGQHRSQKQESYETQINAGHTKNPRFEVAKRPIRGNTAGKSALDKPYQFARVAAYCSTEVVGIQRPRGFDPPSVSSGPPSRSVGYVP